MSDGQSYTRAPKKNGLELKEIKDTLVKTLHCWDEVDDVGRASWCPACLQAGSGRTPVVWPRTWTESAAPRISALRLTHGKGVAPAIP